MKNLVLISLLFIFLISCSEEEITCVNPEPEITLQKKQLIDSIYGEWILYGVGYSIITPNSSSGTTIENFPQSEICNFISTNIDGISIGQQIKIVKNSDNITIDKIYGCSESYIYNTAYLNINVLYGETQARMEEYMNTKTLINYHITQLNDLKTNRMSMRVEFDHRTDIVYILKYKKKNT